MTIRVIKNSNDADRLAAFLKSQDGVFTVHIEKGEHRTSSQNRLLAQWIIDISNQSHESIEDVRARLKLEHGVPILRAYNEAFQAAYDTTIKNLTYEQKITIMKEPLSFPVTRLMTKDQFVEMLNDIQKTYLEQGFELTNPDDLKRRE